MVEEAERIEVQHNGTRVVIEGRVPVRLVLAAAIFAAIFIGAAWWMLWLKSAPTPTGGNTSAASFIEGLAWGTLKS